MQLILLIALLLLGSSSPGNEQKNKIAELCEPETLEIIKEISGGGEQVDAFMKEVEQISELVTAFAPLISSAPAAQEGSSDKNVSRSPDFTDGQKESKARETAYILKPVGNIADDCIYNALARAV